jgi:hypothetical protein
MNWNYIGIDDDPPAGKILVLTTQGIIIESTRACQLMVAWHPLIRTDAVKVACQEILRGLPELKMVACICKNDKLRNELVTALVHYHDDQLADFTNFIRTLDRQAHNGMPCVPTHK